MCIRDRSERDLKAIGIIPKSFPEFGNLEETVRATRQKETDAEVEAVCDKYAGVFAETLDGRKPISCGGKAKIILKDNAVPFRCSVARRPPKALAPQAEKLLSELESSKVIEAVNYPTEWCHHGMFVRKPDDRT